MMKTPTAPTCTPNSVEPNRPTLQALVRYMAEQHFIANAMPIEDLFVPIWGTSAT